MNQIEQFLENLSSREKILIYLTTILLAILLSFHFYHSYLKSFFLIMNFSFKVMIWIK